MNKTKLTLRADRERWNPNGGLIVLAGVALVVISQVAIGNGCQHWSVGVIFVVGMLSSLYGLLLFMQPKKTP